MDEMVRDWLLAGDPAIRWQVEQDLLGEMPAAQRSRLQVEQTGWGARLLELQDPDGTWGQAIYSPKWTSTTYTLLLLYRMGLRNDHPAAVKGAGILVDRARIVDRGITFAKTLREPETCITGMIVLLGAYFGLDSDILDDATRWLLDEQMPDGGWNCEKLRSGASHGSFHTSITVLEALFERRLRRPDPRVEDALDGGHRFFLDHRLFRSHRTGQISDAAFTKFSFPPYWHYDVLRGLDHFATVRHPPDEALSDAIDLVRKRRRSDGRWPLQNVHRNRTWFTMERGGQPSRWNTLRALRVLEWSNPHRRDL